MPNLIGERGRCVDSMLGRIGMVCGLYLKGPWVGRRLGLLSKGEKGQRVLGGNGCIQTMWVPDARNASQLHT